MGWELIGKTERGLFVWQMDDDLGPGFQVTKEPSPPALDGGRYANLEALLKLKGDRMGVRL